MNATTLLPRVIEVLEQPVRVSGKDLYSSTSIGIVLGQSHYHTPEELLRDADVALYRAKEGGRADVQCAGGGRETEVG